MQDKELNPAQSLEIIQQMIAATRRKFEQGGGTIFLIWGYTSLLVSIAVVALLILTESYMVGWLWWAIPLIGYPSTLYVLRNQPRPTRTYIDTFIGYIWLTVGITAMLLPLMGIFKPVVYMMVLPVESLILSMGVILTGLTIKFKPLIIGGVLALLLSFLMLHISTGYVYVFMAMFVVAMIIPGHILNYKGRCSKN